MQYINKFVYFVKEKDMDLEKQIYEILQESLSPKTLEVVNDSHKHAGHAGDDGSGQSHFTIIISASCFDGVSRLERHRLIYDALSDKMDKLPHAISIKATD